MAVSRYDNPAKYTPVDDYVKFPIEFLVSALGTKQKAYDETEGTNESSVKAVNEIITLDQVRTNTRNTETTTAVDKKLKQDFLEKINKDISQLTEDVNGDLSGSGASKRAKAIANEVNAFKSDFGVKAKTRYDNYNTTIKQLETAKSDPASVTQGVFNQVNQSLGGDYGDFNKSYTSKQNDYIDEAESIAKQMSLAKQSIHESLALVDNGSTSLAQLAKDKGVNIDLGDRGGVVNMGYQRKAYAAGVIQNIQDAWFRNVGNGVTIQRLDAFEYNNGIKLTPEEREAKKTQITNDYQNMFRSFDNEEVTKTLSFNQDPSSGSGSGDKNSEGMPTFESMVDGSSFDTKGKTVELSVTSINNKILNINKTISDLDKQLAAQEKGGQKGSAIYNTLLADKEEQIRMRANAQHMSRTALQTVIRGSMPKMIMEVKPITMMLSKNFIIDPKIAEKGYTAIYKKLVTLDVKDHFNVKDNISEDNMKILKTDPDFKEFHDHLEKQLIAEHNRSFSTPLTSKLLKYEINHYISTLGIDIEKQAQPILTEANNRVNKANTLTVNVAEKPNKSSTDFMIAAHGLTGTATEMNSKELVDGLPVPFVKEGEIISSYPHLQGSKAGFIMEFKNKDGKITKKTVLYNTLPKPYKDALIKNTIKVMKLRTSDAEDQALATVRVLYPEMDDIIGNTNGVMTDDGHEVFGVYETKKGSGLNLAGVNKVHIHQIPNDPENSYITIDDSKEQISIEDFGVALFLKHHMPQEQPKK